MRWGGGCCCCCCFDSIHSYWTLLNYHNHANCKHFFAPPPPSRHILWKYFQKEFCKYVFCCCGLLLYLPVKRRLLQRQQQQQQQPFTAGSGLGWYANDLWILYQIEFIMPLLILLRMPFSENCVANLLLRLNTKRINYILCAPVNVI